MMPDRRPVTRDSSGARLGRAIARSLGRLSRENLPLRWRRGVRPVITRLRYVGLSPQDVLVASYPRSGSTWLRFLLTEILMQQSVEWPLVNRVIPGAGGHFDAPTILPNGGRLIQTHDRYAGPCSRAVYLVRDNRDVILSEYRYALRGGVHRSLDKQIELSLTGGTPMSLFGSWHDHVAYWLDSELARRGDLLLMKFEELRHDPDAKLRELLRFLGADATDAQIASAIENNSIRRMREREEHAVGAGISAGDPRYPWIGQGAVTGWRSKMSDDQLARVEAMVGDVLTRLGYPSTDRPDAN
jgi:Sulfotransferase domain